MSRPILVIEHTTTHDMEDGQPLPPLIVDGAFWCVVRRLPGNRSCWRRILPVEQIDVHDDPAGDLQ
jgi:hypothetical protein